MWGHPAILWYNHIFEYERNIEDRIESAWEIVAGRVVGFEYCLTWAMLTHSEQVGLSKLVAI